VQKSCLSAALKLLVSSPLCRVSVDSLLLTLIHSQTSIVDTIWLRMRLSNAWRRIRQRAVEYLLQILIVATLFIFLAQQFDAARVSSWMLGWRNEIVLVMVLACATWLYHSTQSAITRVRQDFLATQPIALSRREHYARSLIAFELFVVALLVALILLKIFEARTAGAFLLMVSLLAITIMPWQRLQSVFHASSGGIHETTNRTRVHANAFQQLFVSNLLGPAKWRWAWCLLLLALPLGLGLRQLVTVVLAFAFICDLGLSMSALRKSLWQLAGLFAAQPCAPDRLYKIMWRFSARAYFDTLGLALVLALQAWYWAALVALAIAVVAVLMSSHWAFADRRQSLSSAKRSMHEMVSYVVLGLIANGMSVAVPFAVLGLCIYIRRRGMRAAANFGAGQ
jgi:hypothetical protein